MIAIYDLHTVPREEILSRKRAGTPPEVEASVAEILEAVRLRGDAAVLEYGARFGGAELTALRVDDAELETAAARCAPALLSALKHPAVRTEDADYPLCVVRPENIHRGHKGVGRVIFAYALHPVAEALSPASFEVSDGGCAERIVHHPVEHPSQQVFPPLAVAYLV